MNLFHQRILIFTLLIDLTPLNPVSYELSHVFKSNESFTSLKMADGICTITCKGVANSFR